MQPVVVLVLLPLAIGLACGWALREIQRAAVAATLLAPFAVGACVVFLNPGDNWNWLAVLLVAPLVVALSLSATMISGRRPRTHHGRHADSV